MKLTEAQELEVILAVCHKNRERRVILALLKNLISGKPLNADNKSTIERIKNKIVIHSDFLKQVKNYGGVA